MTDNIFEIVESYMRAPGPTDVDGLAKVLGINVKRASLNGDISGMIERDSSKNKFTIVVNNAHSAERQRFTIAHELGHYIYHKDSIGDGIADDSAYRSTEAGKYHNTKIGTQEETQANKFAAGLLMPTTKIHKLQAEGHTDVKVLAKKLGVSIPAMKIRLEKLS